MNKLFVFCLVFAILVLLLDHADAKNLRARQRTKNVHLFRKSQLECSEKCDVNSDRDNCIYKCISPTCYNEVILNYQLEPGEVDTRDEFFKECFHRVMQESKMKSSGTTLQKFISLNIILLIMYIL